MSKVLPGPIDARRQRVIRAGVLALLNIGAAPAPAAAARPAQAAADSAAFVSAPPRASEAAAFKDSSTRSAHESLPQITLDVGQTFNLATPGVARVAVGSGQVVQAAAVEGREVVLFGRGEGTSSVQIWRRGQRTLTYTVHVRPAGFTAMRAEVQALLQHVPNARSSVAGDSIVIEGDGLSDDDRTRIAALAERYPRIVDFTGQVGWDNMVMLDVQVVELPRSRLREFGLGWDLQSAAPPRSGVQWQFPAVAAPAPRQWLLQAGVSARLNALAERGDAMMLARPQLIARSGSTASFLAGGEVPYTSVQRDERSETRFKPYGVRLTITPHIDATGGVRCRIEVEASAIDGSLSLPAGPALRTRRASTEFNVPSGRTLVLGGFLSRETSVQRSGLPLLGDIPGIGALFSVQRESRRDTELAIFVTPTIMGAEHPVHARRLERADRQLRAAFPEHTPLGLDMPVGGARPAPTTWHRGSQWAPEPEFDGGSQATAGPGTRAGTRADTSTDTSAGKAAGVGLDGASHAAADADPRTAADPRADGGRSQWEAR